MCMSLTLWLNMSVSCRRVVYWRKCCWIHSIRSTSSFSSSCSGKKGKRQHMSQIRRRQKLLTEGTHHALQQQVSSKSWGNFIQVIKIKTTDVSRTTPSLLKVQKLYHAGGDHLFKPLGLSLVVEVHTSHQVVSWTRNGDKRLSRGQYLEGGRNWHNLSFVVFF